MNLKNPFNNKKDSKSYLLKNGKLINIKERKIEYKDLLLDDKKIKQIKKGIKINSKDVEVIDCDGLMIAPGLVDMRVNIGEPGSEHKETVKSVSMSAASGGVTSLVCMPNTSPPIDQPAIIQSIQRKAREIALSKFYCTGCITRGAIGKEICELQLMRESGALGFTDGYKSIANVRVMKRALNYAKSFDGLIIQHAEEPDLSEEGVVNEGEFSTRLGLVGIPSYAEAMIVERDLWLVRDTGCRYHVSHISSKDTVEVIRKAKKEGLKITCDTAPPYFLLNEFALENYRTFLKLSPPLKTEEDRQEIIKGLTDGTIDSIVSDHTPHDQDAKRLPFNQAEFGGIGLETLLPCTLSLVKNKLLDIFSAISLISINPSKILGLDSGIIEEGSEADISIFDPERSWKVSSESFYSKSKNSPFDGMLLEGKNIMTFVRGKLVYKS